MLMGLNISNIPIQSPNSLPKDLPSADELKQPSIQASIPTLTYNDPNPFLDNYSRSPMADSSNIREDNNADSSNIVITEYQIPSLFLNNVMIPPKINVTPLESSRVVNPNEIINGNILPFTENISSLFVNANGYDKDFNHLGATHQFLKNQPVLTTSISNQEQSKSTLFFSYGFNRFKNTSYDQGSPYNDLTNDPKGLDCISFVGRTLMELNSNGTLLTQLGQNWFSAIKPINGNPIHGLYENASKGLYNLAIITNVEQLKAGDLVVQSDFGHIEIITDVNPKKHLIKSEGFSAASNDAIIQRNNAYDPNIVWGNNPKYVRIKEING